MRIDRGGSGARRLATAPRLRQIKCSCRKPSGFRRCNCRQRPDTRCLPSCRTCNRPCILTESQRRTVPEAKRKKAAMGTGPCPISNTHNLGYARCRSESRGRRRRIHYSASHSSRRERSNCSSRRNNTRSRRRFEPRKGPLQDLNYPFPAQSCRRRVESIWFPPSKQPLRVSCAFRLSIHRRGVRRKGVPAIQNAKHPRRGSVICGS